MSLMKYEWKLNAIYKKWELYLYRLYQLAKYLEGSLRIFRINSPEPEEILNPNGYEDSIVRIPPNPFVRRDEQYFLWVYDHFIDYGYSDSDKDRRKLYIEVWGRLREVKDFLGVTKGTRYIGEEREEARLLNEVSLYIDFYEDAPMVYRIVLGDPEKYKRDILQFRRFLADRSRIKGVRCLNN